MPLFLTGVFAVSSISPLPERSDINDPFKKFSDGEIERCDGPKVPVQKLSDGEIESRIGTSYDGPKVSCAVPWPSILHAHAFS